MDPTVVSGNMFSHKGAQNHIVSDMWKDTVRREIGIARRWQSTYNRKAYDKERTWVSKAMMESEKEARAISPSRTLPASLRGSAGQQEDAEARRRGLDMSRKELLTLHRESGQQGRMATASRDIGTRATQRTNIVAMAERRAQSPETSHGRKPVIAGSFFRKGGVF